MRIQTDPEAVSIVNSAVQLENQFAENDHSGSHTGPELIEIHGDVPIILSSPHAVNHPREGRIKLADTYTGTLTIQLASLTGANALVYARTSKEDPNYDIDGPYKRRLAELVENNEGRFVLDIHGLHRSRPMELAIGTVQGETLGQNKELLTVFTRLLEEAGFKKILVDHPQLFNGSRPTSITSFTWRELRIPALQLEIHKLYRDAENAPEQYLKMLYALRDIINEIQKLL